jgi:hypothetical protein
MTIPSVPSFRRSRGVAGSFLVPLLLATTIRAEEIPPPSEAQPTSAPVVTEPAVPQPPSSPSPAPAPAPVVAPAPRKINLTLPEEKPECVSKDEPAEGAGMFFVGVGFFDFSALNRRLRAAGYETIDDGLTLLGGEGRAIMPSGFVAGARGGALLASDGHGPNGFERSFSGGFGMLDLGFALIRTPALLLTLTSGLGGYGVSLGISDRQSVRFDDVLQAPARSSSVSRGGLLVGLALGLDGRVPVGTVERGRRGFFTLGARVGALYGPPLGGWGLDEGGDATAGPGRGLTGVYGALAIGFGGGPVADRR